MAEPPATPTEPSRNLVGVDPVPAVLAHLVAVARAKVADHGTAQIQPAGPGRYVITLCRGTQELAMMFARRRREWALTAAGMITDGQAHAIRCRTIADAIRLLSGQDPGTGQPS